MPDAPALVFTCEHASPALPALPAPFRSRFRVRLERIPEHRIFDRGAAGLAAALAHRFHAPLHEARYSRLLVDCNRSIGHRDLFSELTRTLPVGFRRDILATAYRPYRESAAGDVNRLIRCGRPVVHVSIHTFTPVWKGVLRRTDVGLLFDPSRSFEKKVAVSWRRFLAEEVPGLAVHFNRPYRGDSDGFTTALRNGKKDGKYAGIEIEVNQKFFAAGRASDARRIRDAIGRSLEKAVSDLRPASAGKRVRSGFNPSAR